KTNIEKYATNIYFEADMAFDNCNLATVQFKVFASELIKYNAEFVSTLHHIDYGFTPEYKY
ncbi:MAG: hypothetical protein LBE97_02165, partial [Holosporales bacterium]|nr:hypothetical protein [Holosporales bacterium]